MEQTDKVLMGESDISLGWQAYHRASLYGWRRYDMFLYVRVLPIQTPFDFVYYLPESICCNNLHLHCFTWTGSLVSFILLSSPQWSFYYGTVKQISPIKARLVVLPETLTLVTASVVTGLMVTRTGCYRWAIWTGWIVITLWMGLLILLNIRMSAENWSDWS